VSPAARDALEAWTAAHSDAAEREHWCVSDCAGSMWGEVQIQKLDDHKLNTLADDLEAWKIVITGTKPHHVAAAAMMREYHPTEWQSICYHAAKEVKHSNVNPTLLADVIAASLLPEPYGVD
jgi:hypothetical protein